MGLVLVSRSGANSPGYSCLDQLVFPVTLKIILETSILFSIVHIVSEEMSHKLFCILLPVTLYFHIPVSGDFLNNSDFKTDLENTLDYVYPKDNTLDTLEESVRKFIHNIEDLIIEINEASSAYMENLEHEKINQILLLFNSPPCVGGQRLESMKKSFRIELGLLEVSVREAVAELKDKFGEMKRSLNIERSILEVKLMFCQLVENSFCPNETIRYSPCLNDSCSPPQALVTLRSSPQPSSRDGGLQPGSRQLLSTECADGRFKCSNGQCIKFSYACDGGQDCSDGSDERSGCLRSCSGKRCRNLNCITEDKICNGVDDCGDGTDEEGCQRYTEDSCSLSSEKYLCSDKAKCLPLTDVCNGKDDCMDGSDEGGNCSTSSDCMNCVSVGGACLRTPSGPLCLRKCPSDFVLDLKSGVCISSQSTSKPFILYKTNSFMGTIDKVKILSRRFSNGFVLLKKQMYHEIEKTVRNLNKCAQGTEGSLNSPFFVI